MRCMISKLTLLAAVLMITTVPVFADDAAMDKAIQQGHQGEKDECLLVSLNCANQVDTIQQRIDRIKGEISRGSDVYTNDELNKLNRELDETIQQLDDLNQGGG